MMQNANVGCVLGATYVESKTSCILAYTRCGACEFLHGKCCDISGCNVTLTEGYAWQMAMALGYYDIIPSEPEFVIMDLVRLMMVHETRLTSVMMTLDSDKKMVVVPLQYVRASFVQ